MVALGAALVLLLAQLASAQYLCTYTRDVNISAPDMGPAKFVVSSYDCCRLCSDTDGCVASIYSNYYCHLKATTQPQVKAIGPSLITQEGPTIVPMTSQPAGPTIVPPPIPSPPVTHPSGPVTLVREIACQYSATCSRRQDYSCVTNVYASDQCLNGVTRQCRKTTIEVQKFGSNSCPEPANEISVEPLDQCVATPDETYVGHYCDTWPAPTVNLTMSRTVCPYGCDDGQECTHHSWLTGTCVRNPLSSVSGESLIVWCFPDYVVFSGYGGLQCEGSPTQSIAEPIGQHCFLDNNQEHHQNLCG